MQAGAGSSTLAPADLPASAVGEVDDLLSRRLAAAAAAKAEVLTRSHPGAAVAWLLLARARQQLADFSGMQDAAEAAAQLAPDNPVAGFMVIEALLHVGEIAAGRAAIAMLEILPHVDFAHWRQLTEFHVHLGQQLDAERCARKALELRPTDTGARYALASTLVATGATEEAELLFDSLIATASPDGDAAYNRSTLRTQTASHHHLPDLRRHLATAPPSAVIGLHYALAKELEDLGDDANAFKHLQAGAAARRVRLSYRVEADEAVMAQIAQTFTADWLGSVQRGSPETGPLFIVGLPRSGTTLIERILGRHSAIGSVGEVNELPLAVTRAANALPTASADLLAARQGLVQRAAQADMTALGRSYCKALRGYGVPGTYVIDKSPLNFLYLGLMAAALPGAKVIHVRRHPLASGYAMFKTLFRMGYPFSYDQQDLGRYQLAYLKLMNHWREVLPGDFLEVDYEAVINDQPGQTKRLLDYCQLPWEDACLSFHEDKRPTATASAAQVRRPIYRESLNQWRRHAADLAPLARVLSAGGVNVA